MPERLAAIFLLIALLLSACARQALEELPDSDAIGIYDRFLTDLSGVQIIRLSVELDEPVRLMRPMREEISLSAAGDVRTMTYRVYNPLIFWNIGPSDYYDGESYYYKYKDDWFIDHYGRFRRRLEPEFLGIPATMLNREHILSSKVYGTAKGCELEIVSENPDDGLVYTITGTADTDFCIQKIEIRAHRKEEKATLAGYYSIRYKKRGEGEEIAPPADLELSEIEYLKQYYDEQAHLVPVGAPAEAELTEE